MALGLRGPAHLLWKHQYWAYLGSRLSEWGVDCVLDVGANVGQYASALRELGYRGWIISFEPIPDVFRQLQDQFASDDRWHGVIGAVGERHGRERLHVPIRSSQHASLRPLLDSEPTVQLDVEVYTLDSLVATLDQVTLAQALFLKLDTQGTEVDILNGGIEVLEKVVAVQAELSVRTLYEGAPTLERTVNEFHNRGYVLDGVFETVRRGRGRWLNEVDAIFVRQSVTNE